jgi:hypothetical protein
MSMNIKGSGRGPKIGSQRDVQQTTSQPGVQQTQSTSKSERKSGVQPKTDTGTPISEDKAKLTSSQKDLILELPPGTKTERSPRKKPKGLQKIQNDRKRQQITKRIRDQKITLKDGTTVGPDKNLSFQVPKEPPSPQKKEGRITAQTHPEAFERFKNLQTKYSDRTSRT